MSILFVAAVEFELDVARRVWGEAVLARRNSRHSGLDPESPFLCAGVGPDATLRSLEARWREEPAFDRVVDIGIAGSYRASLPLGSVVHVTAEQRGDAPGPLLRQPAPWPELAFLPACTGNTLQRLDDRFRQVAADVESMEGAAVFAFCLRRGIPFAEIRAVSNFVGETDHARWDIPLALRNLESALETFKNACTCF